MVIEVGEEKQYKKVHAIIETELYKKLWELASRRFDRPGRKLYLILNEAIQEYVEKYYK